MKICENCKKEIQEREHYYKVVEYFDKKIKSKKFVHKICQDNWQNQIIKSNLEAQKQSKELIQMAKGFMKRLGEDEVVIV